METFVKYYNFLKEIRETSGEVFIKTADFHIVAEFHFEKLFVQF